MIISCGIVESDIKKAKHPPREQAPFVRAFLFLRPLVRPRGRKRPPDFGRQRAAAPRQRAKGKETAERRHEPRARVRPARKGAPWLAAFYNIAYDGGGCRVPAAVISNVIGQRAGRRRRRGGGNDAAGSSTPPRRDREQQTGNFPVRFQLMFHVPEKSSARHLPSTFFSGNHLPPRWKSPSG